MIFYKYLVFIPITIVYKDKSSDGLDQRDTPIIQIHQRQKTINFLKVHCLTKNEHTKTGVRLGRPYHTQTHTEILKTHTHTQNNTKRKKYFNGKFN